MCTFTQVAASLLQACYLAVIKPISGRVRIACYGLMIISLLKLSTGLMQVDDEDFLFTFVFSTTCSESANIKLQQI